MWFLYPSSESSHLSPPISSLCSLVFTTFLHPQVSPYLLLSEFPFSSPRDTYILPSHRCISVSPYRLSSSCCHITLPLHLPNPPVSSISFLSLFIPGWWNKQRTGFDVAPVPGPHGRSMCAWACSFPSLPWQALGVIMAERRVKRAKSGLCYWPLPSQAHITHIKELGAGPETEHRPLNTWRGKSFHVFTCCRGGGLGTSWLPLRVASNFRTHWLVSGGIFKIQSNTDTKRSKRRKRLRKFSQTQMPSGHFKASH